MFLHFTFILIGLHGFHYTIQIKIDLIDGKLKETQKLITG